jgi:hypothetical protein
MSIFDKIKNFGSSVVSGIGAAFTSAPVRTPSLTTPGIAPTGNGFGRILDSAISRITNYINPTKRTSPTPTQAPTTAAQTPFVIFDDRAVGGDGKVFGVSQKVLLMVAAGLVGFLVFKRIK